MKTYDVFDLTSDSYLNPVGAAYGDSSGTHQRNISAITSISVHHDAVPRPHDYDSTARYRSEAASHYQRLGPGLQYHYKIDNVGTIFKIRPLTTWLYSVGSSENTSMLAICLDGNFENEQPTREQLEALYQLLLELCTMHPEFSATWPDVRPHADYSATACPGRNLRYRILAIQDEATAKAQLLNQGVFDWPEYQDGYITQPNIVVPIVVPIVDIVSTPVAPPAPAITIPVTITEPIKLVEPEKETPVSTPIISVPVPLTPQPKIVAVGLTGAITVVLLWIIGQFGITVPAEIGSAITVLIATAGGYLISNK